MATIYLDNNATTRVHPEVLELMIRHWRDSFANPGSRHLPGRRARQAMESAREQIASLLDAQPDEVVLTSGGTEANNLALLGLTIGPPGTISLPAGEHPSITEAVRKRTQEGWRLQTLPIDQDGRLVANTGSGLASDSRLVAVILAHNETGVIQDLTALAAQCRSRNIPLHVDAVQAVGKIPVNFRALGATTLALGAHKFHGPRGIGALLVRRDCKLSPIGFGGHQESGRRPGTEVVPLIVGMARALELFHAERQARTTRLTTLRDRLEQGLLEHCPPVLLNGSREHRLPNTLNVGFPGVDGEALLVALDLEGIACSLGSTCASGSAEPAPVLLAMQRPPEVLRSSVRFSLGYDTTEAEILEAAKIISRVVKRLRQPAV